VVDQRYRTPGQNHNAIEPQATTAVWDGDRLTVHEATQGVDWVRRQLARRFGVPAADVRVIATYIGGGFGGKGPVWAGTLLTVLAARVVGRPVRMALTREGVYRTVGGRPPTLQRVALGAQSDGTLTALVHTGVSQVGRVGGLPEPVGSQSQHLYAVPNILIRHSTVELDVLPNTFMRAPGEAVGSFALESAMDELATELGMDPVELRMRNEPERNPLDGKRFSRRDLRAAYARGAERFGWAEREPQPRAMREGRWLVGWGVATAFHAPLQMPVDVTVRIGVDGSVLVRCGVHEIGVGAATVVTQVTADALGVPVGRAVGQARFMVGFLRDRRRMVRAALGAHFCEVRVDADTGEIRVSRWLGVFDVGRVLNAKTAASQLRGGIVMGIGAALSEETLVDPRTGRIMNAGLGDYHVPVQADVPAIEIDYLDEPDPTTPLGLLGVGEVGIVGVAAAVANAVHHATGVRVRELPITLDHLL
jgi:xanthine dehydrogenase YagR molybdenum-binding subunit